ncbi:MAG: hypothetical protein AAB110_00595 [Candidatus Desantisbacteria bacterium]
MRRFLSVLVVITIMFVLTTTTAWSWGMYDWWGGYNVATAVSSNGVNFFHYSPYRWGWGWGPGAQASAYTNTYPYASYQNRWGWAGASASAYSVNAGPPARNAMAQATAYNSLWPWWGYGGYANAVTRTNGSPSYAYATARANSCWWYNFTVPRIFWNNWIGINGWNIPFLLNWYYWGWLDGDKDAADMAISTNLWAIDSNTGNKVGILKDGFKDTGWENGIVNSTYTYSQLGNTLNPNDLVFNPNVGGIGQTGWDIIGHNGTLATDTPYEIPFMISAKEVGGDANNVELLVEFQINGNIGQTPEPCTMVLMGSGLLMLAGGTRRKMKGICQSKGMVINDR